jgi:hemerythrin
MSFFDWQDALSVGIVEIDNQHKQLVAMINDLYSAMRAGRGREVLGGIIDKMSQYAVEHFKTEETYMTRFGYSDYSSHKASHDAFIAKVSDFKQSFSQGKILLSIEIMNFLKDWLFQHIAKSDQKYVPFFKEKGLK